MATKNLKKLRALMDKHKLQAKDVAAILGVKEQTVHVWLTRSQAAPIPDAKLRLLELELSQRKR